MTWRTRGGSLSVALLVLCACASGAALDTGAETEGANVAPPAAEIDATSVAGTGVGAGVLEDSASPRVPPVSQVSGESAGASPLADVSGGEEASESDGPDSETLRPNTPCRLDVNASLSEAIRTVGIIVFSTDLGRVDAGYVEFGLDESYGMRAPLDTSAVGYRTVLLGMHQGSEYHYRVVARSGGAVCVSEDDVLTTGFAPETIPPVSVAAISPERVASGFIVTASSRNEAGTIVIYDHLGELVWWYETSIGAISRARMDWDGKFIYARDGNPSAESGGSVVRVSIDGTSEERVAVDTGHHDLATLPDGMLFLTGQGGDGCSRIEKLSSDDELSLVYDLRDAFGENFEGGFSDPCHCNSIHYNPKDDSISVSCLSQNAFVKITTDGELLWVLGGNGSQSHFGGDVQWSRQHGHHMISPNQILFFNNNGLEPATPDGSTFAIATNGGGSLAVQLELDLERKLATRVRSYDGGSSSQTLGDVQQLHNGNILVTYSNAGEVHEVDRDDNLVQAYVLAYGIGYASHRRTLYGPPPIP